MAVAWCRVSPSRDTMWETIVSCHVTATIHRARGGNRVHIIRHALTRVEAVEIGIA